MSRYVKRDNSNYPDPVRAQAHRFSDSVAVYVGGGETTYMRPAEARQLARALNRMACSVERETFGESTCGTVTVEGPDGRNFAYRR